MRLTVGDLDVQVAYLSYIFYSYVEVFVSRAVSWTIAQSWVGVINDLNDILIFGDNWFL